MQQIPASMMRAIDVPRAFALVAVLSLLGVSVYAGGPPGFNVEEVGRWLPDGGRGKGFAVAVDGAVAYFAEGRFLKVLDATDPANPTLLGSIGLPDDVRDVVKVGDYVYLANGGAGIAIVDVSDAAAPVIVGSLDTPEWARGIVVEGSRAYLVEFSGLRILDVSDPTQPFELGVWTTPSGARAAAVEGDLAFMAVEFVGLLIADLSNPAAPVEVGSWNIGGVVIDVVAEGDLAYVADAFDGVSILDVSVPSSPVELAAAGALGANGLTIEGNLLHVAGSGLRSIDVTDPTTPFAVGYWPLGGVDQVAVEGSLAFVVDFDHGLTIVDMSDPGFGGVALERAGLDGSNAEGVVQMIPGGGGIALDAPAGKIYWGVRSCPGNSRIVRSDLDGSNVETVVDGLDQLWDVALDPTGSKIYWTGGTGCTELADLNPAIRRANLDGSSVEVVFNPGGYRAVALTIDSQAGRIYFSSNSDCFPCGAIRRINLDGSGLQTLLSSLESPEELAIDASGGRLFWADQETIMRAGLDGTGVTTIVTETESVSGIALTSNRVYWTTEDVIRKARFNGTDVEDVLAANLPHDIAIDNAGGMMYWMTLGAVPSVAWHVPGSSRDVEVVGSLAYVADMEAGLRIVDVSNPAEPLEVGSREVLDEALDVEVVGNLAYVADDFAGLRIIDVSDPSDPVDVGSFDDPGPQDVELDGDLAYVANFYEGFQILDVSNPAAPFELGALDTFNFAKAVDLVGNLAYVAANPMRIIDVSNPADPVQVGSWPGSAVDVEVAGDFAYVVRSFGNLEIVDVSDPTSPFLVAMHDISNEANSRVEVVGDLAYVGNQDMGLRVIDVSNPAAPQEVGFLGTFADVFSVAVSNDLIYYADGADGMAVAKLTDTDLDDVPDFRDNCPFVPNTSQGDADADLEGDLCDLDDGLIYVTSVDPTLVEWQAEAGFDAWNLYRGDLEVLLDTGVYTQAPGSNDLALQACGLAVPSFADPGPDPGEAAFYLVTGVNVGGEGSLGTDSSGAVRPNTHPCP